jgi:cysteinyl-tRNA synthetase
MKKFYKIIFVLAAFVIYLQLFQCNDENDDNSESTTEYKDKMKTFVRNLSTYVKGIHDNFIIIPQNGHELITQNGELQGDADLDYIDAVDGFGREDLFYGYDDDDVETPASITSDISFYLDKAKLNGAVILVTDYCSTQSNIDDSYTKNGNLGYISFAADHRDLDNIPAYPAEPNNVNTDSIGSPDEIKNFLYLLDHQAYGTKQDFIDAVSGTNYDLLITDLFFDEQEFTPADIRNLRNKANGGKRLIVAYMSIGEAEDYRYYWNSDWETNPPSWLKEENPDWEGNYKVEYWDTNWQQIIFGNETSYVKEILDAGFDGVYLDIIDAFEYFEEME